MLDWRPRGADRIFAPVQVPAGRAAEARRSITGRGDRRPQVAWPVSANDPRICPNQKSQCRHRRIKTPNCPTLHSHNSPNARTRLHRRDRISMESISLRMTNNAKANGKGLGCAIRDSTRYRRAKFRSTGRRPRLPAIRKAAIRSSRPGGVGRSTTLSTVVVLELAQLNGRNARDCAAARMTSFPTEYPPDRSRLTS